MQNQIDSIKYEVTYKGLNLMVKNNKHTLGRFLYKVENTKEYHSC